MVAVAATKRASSDSVPEAAGSLRLPMHRIGVILTTRENTKDAAGDLALGLDRAEHVRNAILNESLPEYTEKLLESLQSAHEEIQSITSSVEALSVRFKPGPIIDFPSFSIEWAHNGVFYTVLARVCLTVCLYESRSKIWLRFLNSYVNGKASPGLEPFKEATKEHLQAFREATERWAATILNTMIPIYERNIQAAFGPQPKITLSIKHIVQFLAVDEGFEAVARLAHDVSANGGRLARCDAGWREFDWLLEAFSPSGNRLDLSLIEHVTERGRSGVFALIEEGPRAVYVGVGALAPGEMLESLSGAIQVTAEIAFMFAKHF
jgi:hypothetical protein